MVRELIIDSKSFKFECFFRYGALVRITESSKKGVFSIILGSKELEWLIFQMEDFFFNKGGKEWVKIFRGASNLLISRLGSNGSGRYIAIEVIGTDGNGKKLIVPEGFEAQGWARLWIFLALSADNPIYAEDIKGKKKMITGDEVFFRVQRPVPSKNGLISSKLHDSLVQGQNQFVSENLKTMAKKPRRDAQLEYRRVGEVENRALPLHRKKKIITDGPGNKKNFLFNNDTSSAQVKEMRGMNGKGPGLMGHDSWGPCTVDELGQGPNKEVDRPHVINPCFNRPVTNFIEPVYNKAGRGILGPYPALFRYGPHSIFMPRLFRKAQWPSKQKFLSSKKEI